MTTLFFIPRIRPRFSPRFLRTFHPGGKLFDACLPGGAHRFTPMAVMRDERQAYKPPRVPDASSALPN